MAKGQYPKIYIPTDAHIWDNDFDIGASENDMVYLLKDKVMGILNHALEENEEIGERAVVRELEFIINEINKI